jgi:hypothetical protein
MPRQINFFHLPDETAQFIDVLRRFSFPTTVICWVILVFSGCDYGMFPEMSDNIKESKSKGVFLCEYIPETNPLVLNDSIRLDIKEAWIENTWTYASYSKISTSPERCQLIILTNNTLAEGYADTWAIGVDFDRYIRPCGYDCLMTNFDSLPVGNRETWKIQAGWHLNPEAEKIIIGELVLLKK